MFTIDSNENTHHPGLIKLLQNIESIPVTVSNLTSGDISYLGRLGQQQIKVGFEIKQAPTDLLASLRDGRLINQLPRLCQDYDLPYLILVGQHFSADAHQKLVEGTISSRFSFHYLNSILAKFEAGGGRIRGVSDYKQLVYLLHSIGRYWAKEEHSETTVWSNKIYASWATKNVDPLVQLYASMGIGPMRAEALSQRFPSLSELSKANESQLQSLPGFGPKSAALVLEFINGPKQVFPKAS